MDKCVSILIPSRFDNRYLLELCIKSIRKYTEYPYKIIIGDAGIDDEAKAFLKTQENLTVIKCPDPLRPKDSLARYAKTPYFMFLHDDVQILRKGWLRKRVEIMDKKPHVGAIGVLALNGAVPNLTWGMKVLFSFSVLNKRFFPLALLIRKAMHDDLEMFWGKLSGFDTGAIAYLQFLKNRKKRKWEFLKYKFSHDIKHWGGMTWVKRKKLLGDKTFLDLNLLEKKREKRIEAIKQLIKENKY